MELKKLIYWTNIIHYGYIACGNLKKKIMNNLQLLIIDCKYGDLSVGWWFLFSLLNMDYLIFIF